MLWQSKRFKIQNMLQYGQLQESRDEKQIAREEQKRILDSIPETETDADLPEVGDAKNEMSEAAIKSSPVWRFLSAIRTTRTYSDASPVIRFVEQFLMI